MRAAGRDVAVDGFSKPYVAAVAYGSAFYGFAAILLSSRPRGGSPGAPGRSRAGIAVWVGTPLLFYMYVAPPFSHACSAFAVALFVTVWLHVRRDMARAAGPSRSACPARSWRWCASRTSSSSRGPPSTSC